MPAEWTGGSARRPGCMLAMWICPRMPSTGCSHVGKRFIWPYICKKVNRKSLATRIAHSGALGLA
eukprot:7156813-Alexandrium_andersonii.AAC.1